MTEAQFFIVSLPQAVLLCHEKFHFAVSSFYSSIVLLCREAVLLSRGQFYLAVHEAVLLCGEELLLCSFTFTYSENFLLCLD